MWNPESTDMESGIHSVESGIQDSLGLPYMGRLLRKFKRNAAKRTENNAIVGMGLVNFTDPQSMDYHEWTTEMDYLNGWLTGLP